jgi:hypothetical protein
MNGLTSVREKFISGVDLNYPGLGNSFAVRKKICPEIADCGIIATNT